MELPKVNTRSHKVVVAPLGDLQWSGKDGPTAVEHAKAHIKRALSLGAWFIGMGDYIDFMSPSNRQRFVGAGFYDTTNKAILAKAEELTQEVYDVILKPTKGRWLGMLEGHHFFEAGGSTSDMWLAEMLDAPMLGTSCFLKLQPSNVVLWAHHGLGGGILPTSGINKLYHTSAGLSGADVYLMGHNTKMGAQRISRPMPNEAHTDLTHRDVLLVNTGGFSKSNIVGHTHGRIRRGDYAEQGMMTPSPLSAPIIYVDGREDGPGRVRVEI